MTHDLPPFLRDMLDHPPTAGDGVHLWMFKVARQLHCHFPATEIIDMLEERVAGCGRHVPRREIVAAVRDSLGCAYELKDDGEYRAAPEQARWPEVDEKRRNAIIQNGPGLADLWELSPLRIESNKQHTEEIIDSLFPGNPLLCCGLTSSVFDTKLREEWRGELTQLQYIVPSPMTDKTGLTKEGKESAHSLNNTGLRRFLICEFDKGTTDQHAALLVHLARFAPMVCVVHSGGKSLHGWFFIEGEPEETVRKFFRYAVSIGADSKLWTKSQFVRMPDGTRDSGKPQTVYFLNFKPLEATQ